jgi:hypothetical protein
MLQSTESKSKGYFRASPSTAFDQYLIDIQKLPLIADPKEERQLLYVDQILIERRGRRGAEVALGLAFGRLTPSRPFTEFYGEGDSERTPPGTRTLLLSGPIVHLGG